MDPFIWGEKPHFCLNFHVKTSKTPSDYIICPMLFFPMSMRTCDDIGVTSSCRWVQPAPLKLESHRGEAKERVRFPSGCECWCSWGACVSPVRCVRGLLRAPRSAHLWCHSKEGLFFCRLLPRNLLHHHGNSLICRPRAFPLQQWNQQWRESAASLTTTATQHHTPEPTSR